MLELARDASSWILVLGGGIFVVIGAVGILRMPDVFTRMHAASISDAFGPAMILLGLMLQAGLTLVTVKLLFVLLFLLFIGPTATHALARAAIHAGIKPLLGRPDAAPPAGANPSELPPARRPLPSRR